MTKFDDLDLEYEDLTALIETATAAGRAATEGYLQARATYSDQRVLAYRRLITIQAELIVALGIEMTAGEIASEWILDAVEMEAAK